jgi:hypothetical protein
MSAKATASFVLAALLAGSFAALPAAAKDHPSSGTAPQTSGIRVQAYLGPMRPSQRVDQPVPPNPYATELVVLDAADRREVARFTTDREGQHIVRLQPGDYIVASPEGGSMRLPRAEEQRVTVPPGKIVPVTLSFDNGMR